MKFFHFSGVSSRAKIASTGHAGTQAPQSMHSSGWMNSISAVSNSGSSFRGWMQSTGQTSTQAASLVPMQGSVMIYATRVLLILRGARNQREQCRRLSAGSPRGSAVQRASITRRFMVHGKLPVAAAVLLVLAGTLLCAQSPGEWPALSAVEGRNAPEY